MNDWKILNEAYVKNDYELMGDIFYKHNSDKLALKYYKKAFNYAKEMTQKAKMEAKNPLNALYFHQLIIDAWNKHECDCKRIIHKIKIYRSLP